MQIDNTLKYIIYTLLGAIFLVPFIVDTSQLFPFITGKAFAFRILAESIFFVWLILAIRNPEYRPRFSLILASVTAFVLMIGISNVFGENPFTSFWSNYERMEGYVNILHLFAMFLAIGSVIKTREDWNKFILTSFIISIGIIYSSLQQFLKADNSLGFRLDSSFGNPIYLAIYNLFHIFFGLYLVFAKNFLKNNWYKISIGLVIILHLFVLYQTNTRGAVIGLLCGLFLASILNIFNTQKENKKIWLASIVSVITIIVLVVGFYFVKDSEFVQKNKVLSRFAEISLTSGTSEARLLNWGIATEGFKERPILGWGMGNYSYVFDKYYNPEMYGNETWFDHVHNIVLDWLIAGGIVGLVLYLLILISLVLAIWNNKNYSHLERNIFIGLLCAYFVQNIFVFDNQTSYIYFFILLAIFHSQKNIEISLFKPKLNHNLVYSLSIVLWILLPVTIYAVNAPAYFASTKTIQNLRELPTLKQFPPEQASLRAKKIIERTKQVSAHNSFASFEIRTKGIMEPGFSLLQLPETTLSTAEKQDYLKFAFEEFSKEIKNNSKDAKTAFIFGHYLSSLGNLKNAQNYFEKAITFSPNKQALFLPLAFNYLKLEEKEKAIEIAKAAYDLAGEQKIKPKYDSLWVDYLRVVFVADSVLAEKLIDEEVKSGRINRVELLFKRFIDLDPEQIQNYVGLSALYYQNNRKEDSLDILRVAKEKNPKYQTQIDKLIVEIESGKDPVGTKF